MDYATDLMNESLEGMTAINCASHIAISNQFEKLMQHLTHKERMILGLRYGLIDGCPKDVENIAIEMNLSTDEVIKIETEAFSRLSKTEDYRILDGLLGKFKSACSENSTDNSSFNQFQKFIAQIENCI